MATGITANTVFPLQYPKSDPTLPERGAKAAPVELDFGLDNAFSVNLIQLSEQKYFGPLRCIWIDATQMTQPITVSVNATEQIFAVPAGSSNFYPVVNLNVPVVQFSCPLAEPHLVRVIFLNFVPPIVKAFDGTLLPSQITVLQGTNPWVISGSVSINGTVGITGTVDVANFPAVQVVSGTVTANQGTSPWEVHDANLAPIATGLGGGNAVSTTSQTIIFGGGYNVLSQIVVTNNNASISPGGGQVLLTIGDNGFAILYATLFVGVESSASSNPSSMVAQFQNLNIALNSSSATYAKLSANLTGGSFSVYGGLT